MRKTILSSLMFFDTVARLGSVTGAARALHVTHGAVSRQLRQLEGELGLSLFERRNRAMFLTHHGRKLLGATRQIFDGLERTLGDLRQDADIAPLVVSCEPTITVKWLIPNLPAFNSAHPHIPLHIFAGAGPVDFRQHGVDVALRRNDFYWDHSTHAVEVAREWIGPVCAPALEDGVLNDLGRQTLLHTDRRRSAWDDWGRATGTAPTGKGSQSYEYFHLSIQAAIAGLGVAVGSVYMVQEEIAMGRLVAPLGFVQDGSAYFVLSPCEPGPGDALDTFTAWVRDQMDETRARLKA